MRVRISALILALGLIGFISGALTLPTFTSAESKAPAGPDSSGGTEASVGVASAFEDTCSLLGRQQSGQGCESVAAPAGGPDAISNAIDDLVASLQAAFDLLSQQIKEYIQTRIEETRPLLQPQTNAAPAPSQAAPSPGLADTQTSPSPIQDAANALQEAIQQHVQSQIDQALTGTEPSTTNLGGSVPGCTTEQGVSENAIRTTIRCSQRQVSTNGSSSTSSVQTSSTSVSVSSTSSSDSR